MFDSWQLSREFIILFGIEGLTMLASNQFVFVYNCPSFVGVFNLNLIQCDENMKLERETMMFYVSTLLIVFDS